jgi:hypothetical protein
LEEEAREDWKENGVSYMPTHIHLMWNNVVVEREVDEVRRGRCTGCDGAYLTGF